MEIAVISGKGGTGKSSISAALASITNKVVLADCDVDAANLFILFNPKNYEEHKFIGGQYAILNKDLCTNCGYCIDSCNFNAITFINKEINISEVLCDGCLLCSRICPEKAIKIIDNDDSRMFAGKFRYGEMVYGLLAPGEENSGKLVNFVREKAREIAKKHKIDDIIIDGPPGIGCPVISTIIGVDHVLIVTEPTMTGLHDLKRTIETVNKFKLNKSVFVNKYNINLGIFKHIESYCYQNKTNISGKLPYDDEIIKAMVNLKTISEWLPKSELTDEIKLTFNKIKNLIKQK